MARDYFAEEISAPVAPPPPAVRPSTVPDFFSDEIAGQPPVDGGQAPALVQTIQKFAYGAKVAAKNLPVAGAISSGEAISKDPKALEGTLRAAGEVLPVVPAVIPFNVITNAAVQAQETGADPGKLAKAAVEALPFGKTIRTLATKGPKAVLDQESLTEPLNLRAPREILFNAIKAINPTWEPPKSDNPVKQLGIDVAFDLAGGLGPGALEGGAQHLTQSLTREAEALQGLKTLKNLPDRLERIRAKGAQMRALSTKAPEIVNQAPAAAAEAVKPAEAAANFYAKEIAPEAASTVEVKIPAQKSALKATRLAELEKQYPDITKQAKALQDAASKQQPVFNKGLEGIADDLKLGVKDVLMPDSSTKQARTIGNVKSVDSLVEKALRKNYGPEMAKDHVRGAIFLDNFKQAEDSFAAIKKRFPDAIIEDTRQVPLNKFGYRGINVTTKLADGINGEIQVHTPESWKLKLKSDKIYDKWRDFDEIAMEKATPQKQQAFLRDRNKSRKMWRDFWDGQNQAALSDAAASGEMSLASRNIPKVTDPSGTQTPLSQTSTPPPAAIGDISTIRPSLKTAKFSKSITTSTENISAGTGKVKGKLSPKENLLLAVENAKTKLAANGGEAPAGKTTVRFKTPGGSYEIKNTPEALAEFQKRLEKGVKVGTRDNGSKTQLVKLNNELGFARIPGAGNRFEGMNEEQIRAEVNKLIGERLKGVKEGNKERKFITSVSKAEKTKPDVAVGVEGEYTPITNKATLADADAIIAKDFEAAYKMSLSDDTPTALSNAVAQRMIDHLQNSGRVEDAIKVVEKTAEKATAQGQAIQALSMYSKLTPEGVMQYAEKQLGKARKEIAGKSHFTPEELAKQPAAIQKQLKKLQLTPEFAGQLKGLAQKIQQANTPRQRAIATAQLLKAIANRTPVSIWKKISAAQTIAQLLNIKTAGRNILGNAGFAGLENISDATAAAFDKAVSLATGKRSKVLPNLKVQFRGAIRGGKEGMQDVMLGINTSPTSTQYQLPAPGVFKSKVGQAFEKMLNVELQVPDRMAYTAAYRESLLNQLKAAKAIKPTDEMLEIAHHDALYRTFQDENVITRVFVGLKNALNANPKGLPGKGEFGLGDAIIKYPKTPANILARGIEYSPAGFVKSMLELSKGLLGHGFNQKKFVESAARAFVGTNLVGTGILMHRLGLITGHKKESPNISELKKKVGLGDYKINVSGVKRFVLSGFDPDEAKLRKGDVLKTYDWFLPQSIQVAMGANIDEGNAGPKSQIATIAAAIGAGSRTLAEQPLVSGLQRAFGYGDLVGGMAETFKGVPASFAPTLLRQVAMLVDDVRRNPDNEDPIKEAQNLVTMKLPGLSKSLPAKKDPFGEEVHYLKDSDSLAGRIFAAMAEPANTSKYAVSPDSAQAEEMIKYGVGVTKQGKTLRSIELTQDERDAIDNITGPLAKRLVRMVIESPGYQKLDDLRKQKALEAAVRGAKNAAEIKNAPAIAKRYLSQKEAA